MKKKILIMAICIAAALLGAVYAIGRKAADKTSGPVNQKTTMKITSPGFENGGSLPAKYSCDGLGVNPALKMEGVPGDAVTLALVVDDPDAPMGTFTHWLVWNIAPDTLEIGENSVPVGAVQGRTSDEGNKFVPACPPKGSHRYYFKIYALDAKLDLGPDADAKALSKAMEGRILDQGQTMATYSR